MPNLIRALVCATSLGLCAPANAALIYNFDLNGSYANSAGPGSITPNGGTLGASGYNFGANQGLTINLGGAALNEYAIETRFSFDTTAGYRKILDFLNRVSDTGLYMHSGTLNFYPVVSGSGVFTPGQLDTLRLERTAAGQVTGYVNGVQQWTFSDGGGLAAFAPGNNINLFMDDFATGQGEASAGYVDFVRVFDTANGVIGGAVPEPSAWALMILGFGMVGGALRATRKRAAVAFA